MSDRERRTLERQMAADPDDEDAVARLARMETHAGEGQLATVRRYIGRWCYVEGARMNYVGILCSVTGTPSGDPAALLWERLWRVGDWGRSGPAANHTMEMTTEIGLPQWLPWLAIDAFGLMPESWRGWADAR